MNKKPDPGPQYMRAEDMIAGGKWNEYEMRIEKVLPANTVTGADKKIIDAPIICFHKTKKRFICGKMNARIITFWMGSSNHADWIGRTITILACKGNWFGEPDCPALRVAMPPKGHPRPRVPKRNYGTPLTGNDVGVSS